MREQRAFAAVRTLKNGKTRVLVNSTRLHANDARLLTGTFFADGWPEAKRQGWRIRPVLIRIEDNGGGDAE